MQHGGAVVLGASGFVGTRLVKHLAGRGTPHVGALDIDPPRVRLTGVEYRTHDVRNPIPPDAGAQASIIYNLAAVHRTPGHADGEYFETNVAGALGTVALADACNIRTIAFTSSISVYGPGEATMVEDSPTRPVSAYGKSKLLAERIHEQWLLQGGGRRLIVVRPGVIFGPGENGNYTRLVRAVRRGYFAYPGRRDTIKSGGDVDELLRSIDFALGRQESHILYNYAYPTFSTAEDIVQAIARVTGTTLKPRTVPISLLLGAGAVFEAANAVGLKNPVNRARVMKLYESTKVAPGWLLANGYRFASDIPSALERWREETGGRFD